MPLICLFYAFFVLLHIIILCMRKKTQAIVLHLTRHSDSMSVLHLYTRDFGRVDYAVYGVGSPKSKFKKALLEPLTVVDIDVNHQPTQQLQRVEDIRLAMINHLTALDIRKRSICMFIAEVLYRSLKHPMTDRELYDFLILSIETLEQCDEPQNFHLTFLLRLTQFLGCYPNLDSGGDWLDLRIGEKNYGMPLHPDIIGAEETRLLEMIEASDSLTAADVPMNRQQRNKLLNGMISYYCLHVPGFIQPKSLDILSAVFD